MTPPAASTAAGDFNPGFSFDFGGTGGSKVSQRQVQAPWELSGALEEARREQVDSRATSIDHKIKSRLEQRKDAIAAAGKAKKGGGQKKRKRGEWEDDSEEGASDMDGPEDSTDSEDEPLPGEVVGDGIEDSSDEDADVFEDEDDEAPDAVDEGGDELSNATDNSVNEQDAEASSSGADDGSDHGNLATSRAGRAAETAPSTSAGRGSNDGDGGSDEESPAARQQRSRAEQQLRQQQRAPGAAAAAAAMAATVPLAAGARKLRGKQGAAAGAEPEGYFASAPTGTSFAATSFSDLNLSRPLLRACAALGYAKPTPIQAACIPLALLGRDICGSAVTGSGKTAAFALPALERLLYRPRQIQATYVLVLAPTRELAVQVHSMVTRLAQFTDVQAVLVVGGLSVQVQAAALRKSPEVVVATPGRLIDHLRNTHSVGLEDLQVLVLDEADRLLEMGFKEEIQEIVKMAPRKRQTLLFSATFGEGVQRLVALSLKSPVRLAADAAAAAPSELSQEVVRLKGVLATQKEAVLLALCSRSLSKGRTIVFFRTRARAHRFKILFGLAKLPPAAELHGDMTQAGRLESLERFRRGEVAFLLATDVAARGLDIIGVQVIVNYDAPRSLETYLHRIGRTARAGASGMSVTFIEDANRELLKDIVKKVRRDIKQRVVPPEAVALWQSRVERYTDDVQAVLQEEREERVLRKAEMEATKMSNMIEHEAEIKARPARTWFQTERQKKAVASAAWQAAQAPGGGEHGGGALDSAGEAAASKAKAQKAAEKSAKRNERKMAAAAAGGSKAARRGSGAPDSMAEEQADGTSAKVRGIKTRVRALVQQQGITTAAATRIATRAVTGVKPGKKKRKTGDKSGGVGAGEAGSLFNGDGTGRDMPGGSASAGVGAGGGGSAAASKKKPLSKSEAAKAKRGGKGAKAFKSKKKYKRR